MHISSELLLKFWFFKLYTKLLFAYFSKYIFKLFEFIFYFCILWSLLILKLYIKINIPTRKYYKIREYKKRYNSIENINKFAQSDNTIQYDITKNMIAFCFVFKVTSLQLYIFVFCDFHVIECIALSIIYLCIFMINSIKIIYLLCCFGDVSAPRFQ